MSDIQTMIHADEEEISLVDILRFLQRQWRLLGGITIAIAAISTALSLTKPPSYERSVTLQIKASTLLPEFLPPLADVNRLGNWTAQTIGESEWESVVTASDYETTQRQIPLSLTAPELEQMEATPTSIVLTALMEQWQEQVQVVLTGQTLVLEVQQKRSEQSLGELDRELQQISSNNLPRKEAMEQQRARLLVKQAEVISQLQTLTELEQDLEQMSRALFPVTIASEGEIEQKRSSLVQTFILALIAGFMVAVLIAIVAEQWPHLRAELQAAESEAQ